MIKKWISVIQRCEIPLLKLIFMFILVFAILGLDLITLSSIPLFFLESKSFGGSVSLQSLLSDKKIIFAIILVSFMMRTILSFLFQVIIVKFGIQLQLALRQKILKMKFFGLNDANKNYSVSSDFIFGIQVVPTSVANILIQFFQACGEAIIGIGLIIFIASISSSLFFSFSLSFATIGFFYLYFFKKKTRESGRIENEMVSKMLLQLNEIHSGLTEIRHFKAESFFFERIDRVFRKLADAVLVIKVVSTGTRYILELGFVVVLLIFFFGLDGFKTGEQLLVELGVFTLAGYRLVPGFRAVVAIYVQLVNQQNTADRFLELVDATQKRERTGANIEYFKQNTDFQFDRFEARDLSFSFDEGKYIFRELSFRIDAGDFVGISGPSGSGKSTLVDIVAGNLRGYEGSILVNGEPIDRARFSRDLSYMPQQPFVFSGTVEENICLTDRSDKIKKNQLKKAIHLGNLDFLGENLSGLRRLLHEEGGNFSGGQIQRICLSRAVYFGKKILVIDEGMSKLDIENRREIYKALRSLNENGVTIILVSHDVEVFEYCNRRIKLNSITS